MQSGVLNRQSELILVFERENAISRKFDNAEFKRGTLSDVWQVKRQRSKNKNHSATFPETLIEIILANFSKKKDWVYDPFMGTGTVGVVAKKMGRNFVGSEITEEYFKTAKKRIG